MTKYVINGGKTLNGEVTISGAKNAAVAIVPAALLADGPVRIENVPKIIDVTLQMEIMRELGAQIRLINSTTVEIQNSQNPSLKPHELERKLRASYYLLGVLLGKYGYAEVAMPGGCNFGGVRPIDQHIKGFEALGATVTLPKGGYIRAEAPEEGLHGAHIYFDVVSVGATMNIMLAAVLAKGQTIMENCAKEPHIVDLANFLNAMGANVKGAGTDVIKIRGVERLHGGTYSIIPDQIEAGTFMAAVAACGGSVLVKNVIPKHLECITAKLKEMNVEVTEFDDAVLVRREGRLTKTNIKTMPYPGFPTDMQPQMTTALCLAEGTSIVTEGVWDSRYRYTEELARMGANIHVDGKIAVIEGVEHQAKQMGYETLFCHVDINSPQYEIQLAEILSDMESVIVLLGTEMLEEDFEPYIPASDRIILLDGWSDRYFFNSVLISNTDSAARAVEYLVEKGHREIGYIRGDFRIQAFRYREIGYKRVMEAHGLPIRPEYQATVGTKSETAYVGMKEYLKGTASLPSAFFVDNDTIAIGAMRALKEAGYRVPDDISIIGFDNISYGSICEPPLTTINVYKREMGETAVRELLFAVENHSGVRMKIQVCTDFVERGSVGERRR